MQLSLAANRLVGPNFSKEVARILSSAESASAGRGRPSPPQHQGERPEEPVGNPMTRRGRSQRRGRRTRRGKRTLRRSGTASKTTSGPGDEQGWEAGGPPPEPDALGCKQPPCASLREDDVELTCKGDGRGDMHAMYMWRYLLR